MSNSNTNLQTQSSNALHNAIMEAGSKDRPPMLAPGNYVQWKSRIKRYIDTKPNSELIHHCLQNPPYTYQWAEKTVPVAEGSSETTTERYMENYKNVSQVRRQNYTRYDAQSFYDAMIFNMDSLGKYMLELILHQQQIHQLLKQKKLMQTQEDHSNPIPALNVDSLKVDLVVIQNTCSKKEESNLETASSKSVKECNLNSETKDVHAIKYKMSKA
ncbi:hypothetical protein Tco_0798980 [Tanacetum coccineum]